MSSLKLLLAIISVSFKAQADMGTSHSQGASFATSNLASVQGASKSTDLAQIPDYKTATPKESELSAKSLDTAAAGERYNNIGAQFVISSASKRQRFSINTTTEKFIQNGNLAIKDPMKSMDVTLKSDVQQKDGPLQVTCFEPGEHGIYSCMMTRYPEKKVIRERIYQRTHHWGWGRHRSFFGESINFFDKYEHTPGRQDGDDLWWEGENLHQHYYRSEYSYQKRYLSLDENGAVICSSPIPITQEEYDKEPKEEVIHEEHYMQNCSVLEEKVEKGLCSYGEKTCVQGKETRQIDGIAITRDCWQFKQTYHCRRSVKNTCKELKVSGCFQVKSECHTFEGGACLIYRQTYQCDSGKQSPQKVSAGTGSPFCLTGNCTNSSYTANTEMFQVMSQLSVLKEAQNDIRNAGIIFKGDVRECSRNCVNFKDCCGTGKGWGKDLGLAKCSADEQDLAQKRSKNLCVMVGTYCAKKVLSVCVSKHTSFCCFGNKLSKLIQEQGRAQLGLGWGEAKSPDCRGFTPDGLSRLDFSKMDLSELFEDIQTSFKPKSEDALAQSLSMSQVKENMKHMTSKIDGDQRS